MSPLIRLNSVVFPPPLGPTIVRRSPSTMSRSTSCTACRPPNRRPIPLSWRIGAACSTVDAASVNGLWVLALDLRVEGLAYPRQLALLARRVVAARRRRRTAEGAAERLRDARDLADGLRRQLAVLQVELAVEDVEDRLAVLVEPDRPVQAGVPQRVLQRLLPGRSVDVAAHGPQRPDQAPRVGVVAEQEDRRLLP